MTGAEGRGCARCKRQPAHAAVHTMQACTGARHAPMAAVHRRQKAYVRRGGGRRRRGGGLRCAGGRDLTLGVTCIGRRPA